MEELNYHKSYTRHGGYLKDIPLPHIRRFPNPEHRRQLRIQVSRYAGFPHFFVSLIEETNYLWNSEEGCWQRSWDDKEAEGGTTFSPELANYQEALEWIEKELVNYPESEWEYKVDDYSDMNSNWLIKYNSTQE